jgi:hypothetical protein
MGVLLNVLVVIVLEWPAQVIGYMVTALKRGYSTGAYLHDLHEKEALNKFGYRVKVKAKAQADR